MVKVSPKDVKYESCGETGHIQIKSRKSKALFTQGYHIPGTLYVEMGIDYLTCGNIGEYESMLKQFMYSLFS